MRNVVGATQGLVNFKIWIFIILTAAMHIWSLLSFSFGVSFQVEYRLASRLVNHIPLLIQLLFLFILVLKVILPSHILFILEFGDFFFKPFVNNLTFVDFNRIWTISVKDGN